MEGRTMEALPKTKGIDRSKTYVCRLGCGFETNWPAALGRHESARHGSHPPKIEVIEGKNERNATRKRLQAEAKPPAVPMDRFDRLLSEVRRQQDELLQALKKAYLLALADRDVRTREAERIRTDLNTIYEVLERNRQAREQRISALIR
jgi:hypothetical protein